VTSRTAQLKPWARGPFELLRHADEHLNAGGDTDRRIALIGFDQTVEVCIEVYLRLHPRLRGGVEIKREDVDKALRTFHSKVEFLEEHFSERKLELGVSIEAIVWFHSLRNELYHSGNGMVPELHVLEGAREASVRVFAAIFGDEALEDLRPATAADPEHVLRSAPRGVDPRMDFLQAYVLLEDAFKEAIARKQGSAPAPAGLRQLWSLAEGHYPELRTHRSAVEALNDRRNHLVHYPLDDIEDKAFESAIDVIWNLADEVERLSGRR